MALTRKAKSKKSNVGFARLRSCLCRVWFGRVGCGRCVDGLVRCSVGGPSTADGEPPAMRSPFFFRVGFVLTVSCASLSLAGACIVLPLCDPRFAAAVQMLDI